MRLLAPLALLLAGPLAAQPAMRADADPAAGTLRASASGAPAALDLAVRAETLSPVDGCPGYVAPEAPDAVVEWGGGPLRVWARAAFDATLLVSGPDGEWACNDDAEGTHPAVHVEDAAPGRYAVWVGSFSPGPADPAAALYAGAPPPAPVLDGAADPAAGTLDAAGGFEAARGGIEVNVEAGGPDPAVDLDTGAAACVGYVDADRPTAAVRYTADGGTGTLVVSAYALDDDLTLVVQTPGGSVLCNDDFVGTDPAVVVDGAEGGRYAVWVGTYGAPVEPASATLVLTETAPDVYDVIGDGEIFDEPSDYLGPYSEGTYAPLDLDAAPPVRLALDGDGPASAGVSVRPSILNPVQGNACGGMVEPGPSVGVTLSGDGPVALTATAETDLVLVVQTPGGAWLCSDDADGFDPGVQIDGPEGGLYKVWVGAFGESDEPVEAELAVARGELVVSEAGYGYDESESFGVLLQSDGTYGGDALGGEAGVALDGEAEATVAAGGPLLNPVEGEACAGFVSARPTAAVRAGGPFAVSASSASDDLTLVVQTPGGAWLCSDDALGSDPEVAVEAPEDGAYSVWVGTFSRRDTPPEATLTVRPLPPPPAPPPGRN